MKNRTLFTFPASHAPAMMVPRGGANCYTCSFLVQPSACGNSRYVRWNGSSTFIDARTHEPIRDPHEFCCDWFEPNKRS